MKFKIDSACEAASVFFGTPITKDMIRSRAKYKPLGIYRYFVACWLRSSGFSYPQVAKAMHRSDHTTALYNVERGHREWDGFWLFDDHMARAKGIGHEEADNDPIPTFSLRRASYFTLIRKGEINLSKAAGRVHQLGAKPNWQFSDKCGWEKVA